MVCAVSLSLSFSQNKSRNDAGRVPRRRYNPTVVVLAASSKTEQRTAQFEFRAVVFVHTAIGWWMLGRAEKEEEEEKKYLEINKSKFGQQPFGPADTLSAVQWQ